LGKKMNNVEPVMSMSEIPEAAAGEKGKLRGTGWFVDPAFSLVYNFC